MDERFQIEDNIQRGSDENNSLYNGSNEQNSEESVNDKILGSEDLDKKEYISKTESTTYADQQVPSQDSTDEKNEKRQRRVQENRKGDRPEFKDLGRIDLVQGSVGRAFKGVIKMFLKGKSRGQMEECIDMLDLQSSEKDGLRLIHLLYAIKLPPKQIKAFEEFTEEQKGKMKRFLKSFTDYKKKDNRGNMYNCPFLEFCSRIVAESSDMRK